MPNRQLTARELADLFAPLNRRQCGRARVTGRANRRDRPCVDLPLTPGSTALGFVRCDDHGATVT